MWGRVCPHVIFILFVNIFKASCAEKSSLTFVIDDTLSMTDDIDQVKSSANKIMDIVFEEKSSLIDNMVLVTFNDPSAHVREVTTNREKFLNALSSVQVHNRENNRDCEEMSMKGLIKALNHSRSGSFIYVFTDASAKDYKQSVVVKEMCQQKQSQITFVLTGYCYNLNDDFKVYYDIAAACSGLAFYVFKNDVKEVIQTIGETIKGNKALLTTQIIEPYVYAKIPFNIDEHTEYAIVSVSGYRVSLDIYGPPSTRTKIMWNRNGKVVKISNPGQYVAGVQGLTTTSVVIVGRTDFHFSHGFSELEPRTINDTVLQPIADTNVHLSIAVIDPQHIVEITSAQILQMNEKVIQPELFLKKISNDFYITKSFVAPPHMFKVAVQGIVKDSGKSIRRISKIPITPRQPPKKEPNKMKPIAHIEEGKLIEVEYGSKVKLTCKVRAYPEPTIQWIDSRGNTIEPSSGAVLQNLYEYTSYLEISNLSANDRYCCYVVNTEGIASQKIDVIVKDPFVAISIPPGTTKIVYGSEGTIVCNIKSKMPMNIRWYYADQYTSTNEQIVTSDKYSISADGTQLKIIKMDLGLVNKYTCKASLVDNENVQKAYSTRVEVDGLKIPQLTGETIQKVIKGTTATLECKVIQGIPKPKITWQYMEKPSIRLPSTDNVLSISNVKNTHAGRYKCIAENNVGRDEHITSLIVQDPPKITSVPSTIYQSTEGDTHLRIPCVATGLPKPFITWKLNGLAITASAKYSTEDGNLIIREPKVSDTNIYTCEAANEAGSDNIPFQVYILQVPKLTGDAAKKVQVGKTATIKCALIQGIPKPKITWQYMDKPSIRLSSTDNVLSIYNVKNTHAGRYKCIAENNVGRDEHITSLIVQDPPKITSVPSTVYQSTEGDTLLRIPCVATGLPKPVITWKLNGLAITANAKYSTEDGNLIIREPKVSDTHNYTCEAGNEVGSDKITFQVYILQAPKVTGDAVKTVQVGKTATIRCSVVKGEPKPKIAWQLMNNTASTFVTITGTDSELQITDVKEHHAGQYKCVAENKVGRDEHITALNVEFSPRVITMPSTVYEGFKGDIALRVACDVVGNPRPAITWNINGVVIAANDKYNIEDGALVIKKPDSSDTKSYTCEAKNYIGSVSATFQADVFDSFNSTGISHMVYIIQGENKNLQCAEFNNSESQSVRWFIGGNDIGVYKPYLYIEKASRSDAGNYTCRVSDQHGYTHTFTYVVNVGFPPKLFRPNSLDDWRGDLDAILKNCESSAMPPADIEWTFNGEEFTDRDLTVSGSSNGWGHYTCNVSNLHGSAQRRFDVKSKACLIKRKLEDNQQMPLLLSSEETWPSWKYTQQYLIAEHTDKIILSCANSKETPNSFKNFPKQTELTAICDKQDNFLVDGKNYKLSDLYCSNDIHPSIVKKKVICSTETSELIRVGYNVSGFLETYEVCFDHAKNMPLFTRVIMTKTDGSLSTTQNWVKYPRIGDESVNRGLTCKSPLATCCYSKTQLVDVRDFHHASAQKSTFIDYLNAIPYWRPCEIGQTSWGDISAMVRNQRKTLKQFVAWSGTHTLQKKNGAIIPRFLWKVLRFNEDESIAIIYVNDPSPTDKDIKCKNICTEDENTWFKASNKYTYCCKLSDFLEAFNMNETDVGESLKAVLKKVEKRT